jgi:hypothetical protein
MSRHQRAEYCEITSSPIRQLGEFEVATAGGFWVAAGETRYPLKITA